MNGRVNGELRRLISKRTLAVHLQRQSNMAMYVSKDKVFLFNWAVEVFARLHLLHIVNPAFRRLHYAVACQSVYVGT